MKQRMGITSNDHVIGLQIRTGVGVGEHSLSGNGQAQFFVECAKAITERVNAPVKWYLTTDNSQLKTNLSTNYPQYIVYDPTTAYHIAKINYSAQDKQVSLEQVSQVVAEYMLLATCNDLMISRSGYGETAAYMLHKKR